MTRKAPLVRRLRYAFDNAMSKGPIALIGWLALLALVVILLGAAVIALFGVAQEGSEPIGFLEAAWEGLMRTFDAGTMGADTGWGFRLVMLAVTLGGIFVMSTLIGLLTTGIEARVDELRKGRSTVMESDHTVILGWSEQVFAVVSELLVANTNRRRPCIVILGDKDKVEMEDALRARLGSTGNTRVVCRSGSPIEAANLEIASLNTARAIIVLSPEGDDPDAQVIKTLLAIVNSPQRRSQPYHIVAEIRDAKNLDVARLAGRDEVELVLVSTLVARIIAQTCRQSGLSVVYTELLDFGGDEIYFADEPGLTGKTFGEALLAYEDSSVIGVKPAAGAPRLNPPQDTRIGAGDQIIAISQDDDTVRLSGRTYVSIQHDAIQPPAPAERQPERTLVLGWNQRAATLIAELDHYVAPNSALTVVAERDESELGVVECRSRCSNQTVAWQHGDTTDRRTLDALEVANYQHVIVLCYDALDVQQADARTLITLLHLRDIAQHLERPFSIVTEMLDVRNRALAEVTRADDFIVSGKLVSLILAQVAENKALNAVFADIFDPEGSEIYLKPATDYVKSGVAVSYYTVVEAARQRGEVSIGYRLRAQANDASKAYGVVVNPVKSTALTFGVDDRIIVIAED
jgi:voltage-gated potassium channel Kch